MCARKSGRRGERVRRNPKHSIPSGRGERSGRPISSGSVEAPGLRRVLMRAPERSVSGGSRERPNARFPGDSRRARRRTRRNARFSGGFVGVLRNARRIARCSGLPRHALHRCGTRLGAARTALPGAPRRSRDTPAIPQHLHARLHGDCERVRTGPRPPSERTGSITTPTAASEPSRTSTGSAIGGQYAFGHRPCRTKTTKKSGHRGGSAEQDPRGRFPAPLLARHRHPHRHPHRPGNIGTTRQPWRRASAPPNGSRRLDDGSAAGHPGRRDCRAAPRCALPSATRARPRLLP